MNTLRKLRKDYYVSLEDYYQAIVNDDWSSKIKVREEESIDNGRIEKNRQRYIRDYFLMEKAILNGEDPEKIASRMEKIIMAEVENANEYTGEYELMNMQSKNGYRQALYNYTIKNLNAQEMYREYAYNNPDKGVPDISDIYLACGREVCAGIVFDNLDIGEKRKKLNANSGHLRRLEWVTRHMSVEQIKELYKYAIYRIDLNKGGDFQHLLDLCKGIIQEYFKEIIAENFEIKDEYMEEYMEEYNEQISTGKTKEQIPTIDDIIIDKYLEDNDYTKKLEEYRQEENEKSLAEVHKKTKIGITFSKIKDAITRKFNKNEKRMMQDKSREER